MPQPGALAGSLIGPHIALMSLPVYGGISTHAMAAQNTGWAARFVACSPADIKSVRLSWAAATAPGTVQLRIETVDAAKKPTGTLYDANAVLDITPAAGTQTYTFASPPTTGLVVGTEYAVVLITTVAGTAQTLNSHAGSGAVPTAVLQAADATTRTNFAEVAGVPPCMSLVLEDDTEEVSGFAPFSGAGGATNSIYTTNFIAMRLTTLAPIVVSGIDFIPAKVGTPNGDLIVDIRDAAGNVLSGTSVVLNKVSMTNCNAKRCYAQFSSRLTLAPGTYRICFSSPDSANGSNCYRLYAYAALHANAVGSCRSSSSSDSGSSWSDNALAVPGVWLREDVDIFNRKSIRWRGGR